MPKSRHRSVRPPPRGQPLSGHRRTEDARISTESILGVLRAGDAPRALELALAGLGSRSTDPDLLHIAGVAATRCGQHERAVEFLTGASASRPNDAAIRVNLGLAQTAVGDHQGAAQSYKRACDLVPSDANAFYNLGNALSRLEDHKAAVEAYRRAISLGAKDRADCWNNLGGALASLARHEAAVDAYRNALAIAPEHVDALNNLSVSLLKINLPDEAIKLIERARELGGSKSDWQPRVVALRGTGLVEEALEEIDQVLRLGPDVDAYHLRGVLLSELGRYPSAMLSYLQALRIDPEHAETRFSRSLQLLQHREFGTGWEEYEWRWETEELRTARRRYSEPAWRGEFPIDGKTVLLYAEQGQGDTIQFVRYVQDVLELGARVVLEVQPSLVKLVRASVDPSVTVVAAQSPLPAFEAHCPLLSLPFALRKSRGPQPLSVDAYLRPDSELARAWQTELGSKSRLQVGLVWRGNPKHRNDRNRSLALRSLLPALPVGPDYIVLQQSLTEDENVLLSERLDLRPVARDLGDFADTAALCSQLDLVLSVDTSVAHLAGAMDVPCWLMLPFNPDFRWLLGRSDTPWYPSMRLFRQKSRGDWSTVLAEVAQELARLDPESALHRAA